MVPDGLERLVVTLCKGLSTLGALEPVPSYRHIMVLCSHFENPICDCVHSYSISKHELSSENKAVDCPQLTKIVCMLRLGAHFLPEYIFAEVKCNSVEAAF